METFELFKIKFIITLFFNNPSRRILSGFSPPNFEMQLGDIGSAVGADFSNGFPDFYILPFFYKNFFQVGINGVVVAMLKDDHVFFAGNVLRAYYSAAKNGMNSCIVVGFNVNPVVRDLKGFNRRMMLPAKVTRDDSPLHRPGQMAFISRKVSR